MKKGEDMIKQGYYGLKEACPVLSDRVGDYVLLPKKGWIIIDAQFQHAVPGNHGGLSKEEMQVPLIHIKT